MKPLRSFLDAHLKNRAQHAPPSSSTTPSPNLHSSRRPDVSTNTVSPASSGSSLAASDTVRVYVAYELDDPPPHPGEGWTRFVCISDTHSRTFQVPQGDVLLHSGDLSSWGQFSQLRKTVEWIKELPHPVKVLIAGNHDLCLDSDWGENGVYSLGSPISKHEMAAAVDLLRGEEARDAGIVYLQFESAEIAVRGRTWQVYGSPAAPRYAMGSFQYDGSVSSTDGDHIYANIPTTTEILLTHTPPHGICDTTRRGKHAGCYVLRDRLNSPDLSLCRLHVFGHIHEAQGAEVLPKVQDPEKVRVSVNAAMHMFEPIIVDLLN